MKQYKKVIAVLLTLSLLSNLCACSQKESEETLEDKETKEYIEETLNLAKNEEQEWTYSQEADAWTLSVVSAVAYPELPDKGYRFVFLVIMLKT